jgi:hypothetical protein
MLVKDVLVDVYLVRNAGDRGDPRVDPDAVERAVDRVSAQDVAAARVVSESDSVVFGSAPLAEIPWPVEDRGVPEFVVFNPMAVTPLNPHTCPFYFMDPTISDYDIRTIAKVDPFSIVS